MNVDVDIKVIEDIPVEKIEEYMDLVVFGVARGTLDYTLRDNRFPYLTGNLQISSMAEGVRKEGQCSYYIGAEGADYAEYVWEFPQNVNWTNPDTYSQWYVTEYKEKKELITQNAINNAIRSVK